MEKMKYPIIYQIESILALNKYISPIDIKMSSRLYKRRQGDQKKM